MCKVDGCIDAEFENIGFIDGFGWICTKMRPEAQSSPTTEHLCRIRTPCMNEGCQFQKSIPARHGTSWRPKPGGVVRNRVRLRRPAGLETVAEESIRLAPPGAVVDLDARLQRLSSESELSGMTVGSAMTVGSTWEVLSIPIQETESTESWVGQWDLGSERSNSPATVSSWVECGFAPDLSRQSSTGSFVLLDPDPVSLSRRSSVSSFVLLDHSDSDSSTI
eukprot:TRINITY_DN4475_c0_g1_i2.p1 TRINITY_DN4475_c0_g1~~TRINITY_DN4475_c0_g1_i2.p1  ORF type:complete len:221 (+),score=19.28 TRINITY_DN4475_c0_g1_i2:375-1037(+)